MTDEQIAWALDNNLIKEVRVSVKYGIPSREHLGGCFITVSAMVNVGRLKRLKEQKDLNDGDDNWEYVQSSGVDFILDEWIERVE